MQLLPTIAREVPTPQPIRAMDRWRVLWHGRHDATWVPAGAPGQQPYLDALRAQAEAGQRAVSGWLHDKIAPIDAEAVQLLVLLGQHRRDPAVPPETPPTRAAGDNVDPRPVSKIAPWVLSFREAAAARAEFTRRVRERDEAEQRLGQLGSARHHLIEISRAAAHAYACRYEQLAGLYHAARLRRHPASEHAGTTPVASTQAWLHGDKPLLTLDVDRELEETYGWYLKEFETRTSSRKRPVLEEVSRAS
jgi:hypothetical protein